MTKVNSDVQLVVIKIRLSQSFRQIKTNCRIFIIYLITDPSTIYPEF